MTVAQGSLDFLNMHARRTDPDTSHAAAAHASLRAGSHKATILDTMSQNPHPMTFEQIASLSGLSESQCWKRLSDLRDAQLIVDSGMRVKTKSGTQAIQWTLKPAFDGEV